ncbi:RT0821/Lpp0805 family surface protein [Hoeflea poritis]|uniref:RT0821/Lpp0805 family surface protein n=1 Tax=Hoeflea poritis TaxID=2993659 RepID=A0ABT4VTV9_9HYPH|nr:RT0821/Lpp0805 family surface protein [Hoeflea poritis]MDA4848129.1 RT0821/Lpp0805 family surface protein [Hoeflea poritis]
MKIGYLILSFTFALALAGCSNTGGQSSFLNSFVPQSSGKSSVIDALNGGIIDPTISAQLSSEDRMKALEAEYRALEVAPSGQIVAWQGTQSGVSGEVYAAQPYEVGSQNCRQYVHKIMQGGVETTARGTACRSEDGNWTPLV